MKQDSTGNVNEVPVCLPETPTREKAVLTRKHFEELEGFLRARDVDAICDRTHRLTRAWCEANGRDPDPIIEFLLPPVDSVIAISLTFALIFIARPHRSSSCPQGGAFPNARASRRASH